MRFLCGLCEPRGSRLAAQILQGGRETARLSLLPLGVVAGEVSLP